MTTITTSRWTRVALRALLTVAVGAMVALPLPAAGQTASAEPQVTFTKDIAPILQRSCQKCHRPDGGAPMSLLTYEEARPWWVASATFSEPGTYVLRALADDGGLMAHEDVTIVVDR